MSSNTLIGTDHAHRRRQRQLTWGLLIACLIAACVLSLMVGRGSLQTDEARTVFLRLRAWRIGAAFGIGGALAVAGVMIQAVFQNPLAGPSIIGTTAGATLGGQIALLIYQSALGIGLIAFLGAETIVPFGATIGAIASLMILLALTRKSGDLLVTLLVGFLLSAFFTSLGAYIISKAQQSWELGRAVLVFTMGSISSVGPTQVAMVITVLLIGTALGLSWHRHLDLLLTGDEEARSLGLSVKQVRIWGIVWTAVLSAGAVAVGGNIAFVGLIVPHAMRRFVGQNTAHLLPACAIAGGTFVILCDVLARVGPGQGETPLGVVTGLIGAPIFLYLLRQAQRRRSLHG